VIRIEEESQTVISIGPRVVVEVDGAEETVLGRLGEKEVRERPLDDRQDRDEQEA
jgi:hypothetical protein